MLFVKRHIMQEYACAEHLRGHGEKITPFTCTKTITYAREVITYVIPSRMSVMYFRCAHGNFTYARNNFTRSHDNLPC